MSADPAPRKVLLVDDNAVLLGQTEAYLKLRGFEVTSTSSPFALISMVREQKPEVVVLDVMMPGLDGGRAHDFLGKSGGVSDAPFVIFYSAIEEEQLYRLCKARPGTSYVLKSDGLRALHDAIRKRLPRA